MFNTTLVSKKLIEVVKQQPILFKSSRKSYNDAKRKSRSQKQVAAELGIDGNLIWACCCIVIPWCQILH
jgi:hypothetical protein